MTTIPKPDAIALTYAAVGYKFASEVHPARELTVVERTITGTSRWDVNYRVIFTANGETFAMHYAEGATEMQDYGPFDSCGDEIAVVEARAVQRTVTVYEEVGS